MGAQKDGKFRAENNSGYGEKDKGSTVALGMIRWIWGGCSLGEKFS